MEHVFEIAPTGRARCRGCGKSIAKGDLRFGERIDNPYGEGETSLWFHPRCGAYRRPEPFLSALESTTEDVPDSAELESAARAGVEHRRLPRLAAAERSPTGRARCRSCRELIAKDDWRLALVFYQESRFEPSGFLHARCATGYLGTAEILDRLEHFGPLSPDDRRAVEQAIAAGADLPPPRPAGPSPNGAKPGQGG
jgi:hypothetical protein